MEAVLSVQSINKHYPGFALENVSFSLAPNRIMGLIGKNGAGKSTTLKAILNMVSPESGNVTMFQKNFYQYEKECKQRIGVVFGGIDFYPLQYKQEHHLSCTQTAMHFCLDVVTVCRWEKKFQKEGARGLMKKQATKGSEKRQKKQEQSELQQENKRLSEENYRLRMENDYLKKLNALIQKREKPE